MRIIYLTFISILMLGTVSCNPASKYQAEIAEIDSCLALVDSLEEEYKGIEFDSLRLMVKHVLDNEDSIKKYYMPDTISLEVGTKMSECKGVRKSLGNLDLQKESFDFEFPESRKQLENLKSDITNGVLSEEKVKQFVEEEKKAVNDLNLAFNNFYIMQEKQKSFYYSAVPFIDAFIVEIKNEIAQE